MFKFKKSNVKQHATYITIGSVLKPGKWYKSYLARIDVRICRFENRGKSIPFIDIREFRRPDSLNEYVPSQLGFTLTTPSQIRQLISLLQTVEREILEVEAEDPGPVVGCGPRPNDLPEGVPLRIGSGAIVAPRLCA